MNQRTKRLHMACSICYAFGFFNIKINLKYKKMNREIKFRGYSEQLKSFVYGFYQEVEAEGIGYSYIFWQGHTTPVRADSVAQFTGVYDKNNNEIYEGDTYHQGDKNIEYIVVWHDSGFIGKQKSSSSYAGLEHWKDRIVLVGSAQADA